MAVWEATRHFAIYPNSITTVPDSLTAGAVWLDFDPVFGTYDPFFEFGIRGRSIETLTGPVIQVFPYQEKVGASVTTMSNYRRKIQVADPSYPLTRTTVNSLAAMYHNLGTKYRFYDGENVFRVWFSQNPVGFRYHKALPPWREGRMLTDPPGSDYLFYSYEIVLDAFSVPITAESLT